jgi:hypothetical protein
MELRLFGREAFLIVHTEVFHGAPPVAERNDPLIQSAVQPTSTPHLEPEGHTDARRLGCTASSTPAIGSTTASGHSMAT